MKNKKIEENASLQTKTYNSDKNTAYHNNTVIFTTFNSERDFDSKNKFFGITKVLKMISLFLLFVVMAFMMYSFAKLSGKDVGNTEGRKNSEILSIPIMSLMSMAFMAMVINKGTKTLYTIERRKFTLFMHLLNVIFGLVTPMIMLFFDVSTNKKWMFMFVAISIGEIVRMLVIYLTIYIKSEVTKNLFPIELVKSKRLGLTLFAILIPVLLSLYVFEKRVAQNPDNNILIVLVSLVVIWVIVSLIAILTFIWVSKLDNQTNSFIEEEEKQSATVINYILALIVAPFIGIAFANIKDNGRFNYWIIAAILVSVIMIISYLLFVIKDFKNTKEGKRTPMINSIILSAHIFINAVIMVLMHMLLTRELERWNYVFLIIFGIYTFVLLTINIIFNVELFKYLLKAKLFVIYASFIFTVAQIIVLSMLINNELILTLYNGEISTILFVCQIIPVATLAIIEMSIMLHWTRNSNKFQEKNIANK